MPRIDPLNLTAQFSYQAQGNPPSTRPQSAISNCFPGLEFDFRNLWKNLFVGIELYESGDGDRHLVLGVDAGSAADQAGVEAFDELVEVDGVSVLGKVRRNQGEIPNLMQALELSNALAHVVRKGLAGESARCTFKRGSSEGLRWEASLPVRNVFAGAALAPELAEPGALTQSLCSPWQADYRECGCFYWSASRPDYINVEPDGAGQARGHSWMQTDRGPGAPYVPDTLGDGPGELSYVDLYRKWEQVLRFVIGGRDEP